MQKMIKYPAVLDAFSVKTLMRLDFQIKRENLKKA
jgi:hypothetical protein